MAIINGKEEKLELEYPCNWQYKVMLLAEHSIEDVMIETIINREYDLTLGNKSKTGKYQSFNIELLVHNDEYRIKLFAQFNKHSKVAMVL